MITLRDLVVELMELHEHPPYSFWRTKHGAWIGKNRWGHTRQFTNRAAAERFSQGNVPRLGHPVEKDEPDNREQKQTDDRADIKKIG